MEEDDYYDSRMFHPPARDVGYQGMVNLSVELEADTALQRFCFRPDYPW
jgi:hypothetical protein